MILSLFLKKRGLLMSIVLVEFVFQMVGLFRQTGSLTRIQYSTVPSIAGNIASSEVNIANNATGSSSGANYTEEPPPRPHPHAGARYSNGSWGYIADVTRVRRRIWQRYHDEQQRQTSYATRVFSWIHGQRDDATSPLEPPIAYLPLNEEWERNTVCETKPDKGFEGPHGWDLLANRVQVNGPEPQPISITNATDHPLQLQQRDADDSSTTTSANGSKKSSNVTGKILCVVYTYEASHFRVQGVAETWGWKCDGFFAASTATIDGVNDLGYGAIDLPHIGPEEYQNMWQKTRSILGYLYDNYLEEFDYFYICGDDTFLIVENLRNVLRIIQERVPPGTPLYIGAEIPHPRGFTFAGGGSGYVVNNVALRRLLDEYPQCIDGGRGSAEDRFLGNCLNKLGIRVQDTADALGRQRFHGMDPSFIVTHDASRGYFKSIYVYWAWKRNESVIKYGTDLVSAQSVSFHLAKFPYQMKRLHAILYNSCPKGSVVSDALLRRPLATSVLSRMDRDDFQLPDTFHKYLRIKNN